MTRSLIDADARQFVVRPLCICGGSVLSVLQVDGKSLKKQLIC